MTYPKQKVIFTNPQNQELVTAMIVAQTEGIEKYVTERFTLSFLSLIAKDEFDIKILREHLTQSNMDFHSQDVVFNKYYEENDEHFIVPKDLEDYPVEIKKNYVKTDGESKDYSKEWSFLIYHIINHTSCIHF